MGPLPMGATWLTHMSCNCLVIVRMSLIQYRHCSITWNSAIVPRPANGRHSMGVKGDNRWGSNVIDNRLLTAVSRSDSGLLVRAGFWLARLGLSEANFLMHGWLGVGTPRHMFSRGICWGWVSEANFLSGGSRRRIQTWTQSPYQHIV